MGEWPRARTHFGHTERSWNQHVSHVTTDARNHHAQGACAVRWTEQLTADEDKSGP